MPRPATRASLLPRHCLPHPGTPPWPGAQVEATAADARPSRAGLGTPRRLEALLAQALLAAQSTPRLAAPSHLQLIQIDFRGAA